MSVRKLKKSALVVCSGGMDSVTALYWSLKRYARVEVVTFDYGSNHNRRENACLNRVCKGLGITPTKVLLPLSKYLKSSLFGGAKAVPDGHYAADNMKSTVVPFRNGVMLSFAAGIAESMGLDCIVLGNHSGDHTVYPDCRPEFIDGMSKAIFSGTWKHISVVSPFCGKTKADIVKIGNRLGVPFKDTYSCYKGGAKHCGRCGTCTERREAFELAGVADPTVYVD